MTNPVATRAFYDREVLDVAPQLLGCTIRHAGVAIRLTEVEAYAGAGDPGSHAASGRPTARTAALFADPGTLYVYFTYGMHYCANLVVGGRAPGAGILLRAGEVVDGVDLARQRRVAAARRGRDPVPGQPDPGPRLRDAELARGPARLAVALALGPTHNGLDTLAPGSAVRVHRPGTPVPADAIRRGARVGVRGPGGEELAYPYRFWLDGEPSVSAYRPAANRVRRRSPR